MSSLVAIRLYAKMFLRTCSKAKKCSPNSSLPRSVDPTINVVHHYKNKVKWWRDQQQKQFVLFYEPSKENMMIFMTKETSPWILLHSPALELPECVDFNAKRPSISSLGLSASDLPGSADSLQQETKQKIFSLDSQIFFALDSPAWPIRFKILTRASSSSEGTDGWQMVGCKNAERASSTMVILDLRWVSISLGWVSSPRTKK